MKYAVINAQNEIINVINILEADVADWPAPDGCSLEPLADGASIGDIRADGEWSLPSIAGSIADVIAERTRRLELGFDYTFPDSRGLHHFATTNEDMEGWGAVDSSANAFIAVGSPDQEISILTDTGQVTITAIEWKSVMVAAALWQQPIWQASFALQASDPIPEGYTDDEHWP